MIKNYMEILVDEIYEEVSHNYNHCKCKNYDEDIKSIALNNLPPVYFISTVSKAEKKAFLLDRQRRITVLAALTQAKEILCKKCPDKQKMRETI
ncbi:late competence development ComFB family protein [Clostridium sp. Cult1]|jgi:competence protein ComFB|uniref:late competence development ComFB family protein n=1 Tax=Clostridium sp. Cult1 TaxID=2079002 RepID=UPI001F24243A|nr:late competence development ComFB family protein [Clostridium sp. Cult1]MCF6462330.1 competence protein ComFB [Clostridium sp. Cult1]